MDLSKEETRQHVSGAEQVASREMTIAEYLDHAIRDLERRARTLDELRRSLSQDFLSRGCGRLALALRLGP